MQHHLQSPSYLHRVPECASSRACYRRSCGKRSLLLHSCRQTRYIGVSRDFNSEIWSKACIHVHMNTDALRTVRYCECILAAAAGWHTAGGTHDCSTRRRVDASRPSHAQDDHFVPPRRNKMIKSVGSHVLGQRKHAVAWQMHVQDASSSVT